MRDRILWIAAGASVLAVLGIMGCGGGVASPATPLLVPASATGRVILPQCFTGSTTGMTVSSSVDRQPVAAGGACRNNATLSLNAIPITSVTLDGKPQTTSSVAIPAGSHTVDYQAAPEAQPCSGMQVLNSNANLIIPRIFGPWVILQEGSGGHNSGWTTQKPITVTR